MASFEFQGLYDRNVAAAVCLQLRRARYDAEVNCCWPNEINVYAGRKRQTLGHVAVRDGKLAIICCWQQAAPGHRKVTNCELPLEDPQSIGQMFETLSDARERLHPLGT